MLLQFISGHIEFTVFLVITFTILLITVLDHIRDIVVSFFNRKRPSCKCEHDYDHDEE